MVSSGPEEASGAKLNEILRQQLPAEWKKCKKEANQTRPAADAQVTDIVGPSNSVPPDNSSVSLEDAADIWGIR